MKVHIIPAQSSWEKRGSGKSGEEFCAALCGEEMIRNKDVLRYFPELTSIQMTHDSRGDWCESCMAIYDEKFPRGMQVGSTS